MDTWENFQTVHILFIFDCWVGGQVIWTSSLYNEPCFHMHFQLDDANSIRILSCLVACCVTYLSFIYRSMHNKRWRDYCRQKLTDVKKHVDIKACQDFKAFQSSITHDSNYSWNFIIKKLLEEQWRRKFWRFLRKKRKISSIENSWTKKNFWNDF